MTQVIACAVQLGGMPVPVGGGVRLVEALTGIVTDAGGEVRAGAHVERIVVSGGRAIGVVLAGGETSTRRGPSSPASRRRSSTGRCSAATDVPSDGARRREPVSLRPRRDADPHRDGRAARWAGPEAERLARTAIVHVTPGLDGVSRAVNEAERGLLPGEATIVAGQPCAVDPSRAPDGKWIVWIQLQELPAGRVKGDAAGELDVGDGTWTEELREAYADRICARLGTSITNLDSATLKRIVLSPADLEALDCNLVARRHLRRLVRARPEPPLAPVRGTTPGHRTPVDGLWHIGASTHPGPGLGAGSGYLVAKELTRPPLATPAAPAAPGALVTRLALSEISTAGASFEEDVAAYAAAGFDAIGLWELKLRPTTTRRTSRSSPSTASPSRTACRRSRRSSRSGSPGWRDRTTRQCGRRALRARCAGSPATPRSRSSV